MTQLEDIAKALRQIATQIEELSAPAKAAPAKTKITLEQVRLALTNLASAKGAAPTMALLAGYGVKKLSDLDAIHYEAVMLAADKESGND